MASSPPAQFPATLPNPKKRPSMSSQASQVISNKKPKLHPLRQTSFPANPADANVYLSGMTSARSETGSIANSTFSNVSASKQQPRGRGRPRKSLQVTDDDARSVREGGSNTAGGKNSHAKSVISGAHSGAGANADEEQNEPEEEEEEEDEGHEGDEIQTDEQKQQDQKINVLLGQLTDAQAARHNSYRMMKMKENTVKRIVNQTVSQSIPAGAVNTVQWASKAFAIEIVERAREVQAEFAQAADKNIALEKAARKSCLDAKNRELEDKEKTMREQDPPSTVPEAEKRTIEMDIKRLRDESERYIPNKYRAGLLPDHLREALRRYKADGDGDGFGFDGCSHPLLGAHGAKTWRVGDGASGQRLFR